MGFNIKKGSIPILQIFLIVALAYVAVLVPDTCFASVESSLLNIKSKLTGFVLPVLAVLSLLLAGFSFMTGQERAKQHILYAIIGCAIAFGAQALVDFLSSAVH